MCLKDWLDAKVRNQKTLTCMIILNISHQILDLYVTSHDDHAKKVWIL
jgi:hypothetical protein